MVQSNTTTTGSKKLARPAPFAAAAIGMGWQLAVVVLLPILGGYKLDQTTTSTPAWTIAGLVLAMIGSIIVIRRTLAAFGNFDAGTSEDNGDKERPL